MIKKKALRKIIFLMIMLPLAFIAFSWVYDAFFVEINTTEVDGYYDLLSKHGETTEDFILDLGITENDDPQVEVDRIKTAMGLDDYEVRLAYHNNETPPAYIENNNGILTVYLSRDVKQKKEQINVLTHELGHVYVWGLDDFLLEGYDEEKVVDSSGPFLGLGILVLNGLTDNFFYLPGGEYRTEKKFFGYISPAQFGYLVARYCAEHDIAEENVMPFLTSTGRKYFTMGCNYIARQNTIARGSAGEVAGAYWCPECGYFTRVSLANRIKGLKCPKCSWEGKNRFNFGGALFTTSDVVRPVCAFLNEKSAKLVYILSGTEQLTFFFINHELASPALDSLMTYLIKLPGQSIIIVIGTIVFFGGARYQKYSALIFLSSYTIASFVCRAIRLIVERPRPFNSFGNVRLLVGTYDGFSFPSGYAAISFCLATVIAMRYRKVRYPVFIVATLIAFSRPYLGLNYPSDILVGALIGVLVGYGVTKTANKCYGKWRTKK